ncbi:MAG TPA: hypothetical protein VMT32_04890 [Bryobacteraceae bacterium]|nr:hypothetical protein [Bryobacteraceae bacterium]
MRARIPVLLALGASLACPASADDLSVVESESSQRTFPAVKAIDVDNFDGAVTVTGSDVREIKVEVRKTIRARSPEKIQEARREVQLDMAPRGDGLRIYVDGPFRCKCGDGSVNYRGSRFYGYEVSFDFTLQVPRDTNLRLRTVNRGDIRVERAAGTFDVENINGGVELLEVSGSGHAYALNRPVQVLFSGNPVAASDFGSLNGDVDIAFRPGLSADLWMKTFNGHAYTDFDVTALPSRPAAREERDGKFVYKSNESFGVRVGRGGPELKFDAFNGDIRIRNREK